MKNPFAWRNLNGRVNIELDLSQFFLYWGIFTSILLLSAVSLSCVNTFDCSEFLPTFSYLGAYTFYDKALVWITSAQTIPLIFFFISTFHVSYKYIHWLDSYTLLFLGIVFSTALPSIFVFDEVNSSYYFPLDRLHLIFLSAVLLALGIWMGFSLEWLFKMYIERPRKEIVWVSIYVLCCFVSVLITIDQWKSADGPDYYIQLALSEYLSIVLMVFLPRIYFLALGDLKVAIGQGKLNKIDN